MQIGRKIPIAIDRYLIDGAILALLAIVYAPLLIYWYDGWLNKSVSLVHEYFSHGLIGLPFAAYIAWTHRKQWRKLPHNAHPLGLVLLLLGGLFYLSGQSELVNLSFPAVLAGLCLWFKGIRGFRLQSFPLMLVFLATPTAVPYLIEPYILPLQRFIAGTAAFILVQFGLDVTLVGVNLFVGGRIVEVAPHCAGLKMLFTSLYVALMLLYWSDAWKSRQKRILLLSGAVVVSVVGNIIRNALLTFFHGTGQDSAFHWLHESWGGDVYSAGMLGMLVILLNAIERYCPEEPESSPQLPEGE
ncbi:MULTISPECIES: cyanoexosortase B [unclassified Coleofasciculus]|uniref:cyanoexosortase B n=1 Tax=unclassified Coleofasciculus TaxID=2692782 RepID=UPI001881753E|nr:MULTISPECIES: cyanoexosortase B [unclassified Coleofasciculus]MBE9125874.1 cyanoexosortase B [Coleofasciculus sp. LEGE 07081]MBE9149064.1 cyanoexosortase B [Coleofasciculus sp. LEGE 07092]